MKRLVFVLMMCLVVGACGSKTDNRKKTFPVVGKLLIDGKPVEQVAVYCMPVDGLDKENPTSTSAFTDADGRFEFNTYEKGDGVPEGNYVLTFKWGKFNLVTADYGGDKFKGKYLDPKKSEFKITVSADKSVDGKPIDVGTIELKSK